MEFSVEEHEILKHHLRKADMLRRAIERSRDRAADLILRMRHAREYEVIANSIQQSE